MSSFSQISLNIPFIVKISHIFPHTLSVPSSPREKERDNSHVQRVGVGLTVFSGTRWVIYDASSHSLSSCVRSFWKFSKFRRYTHLYSFAWMRCSLNVVIWLWRKVKSSWYMRWFPLTKRKQFASSFAFSEEILLLATFSDIDLFMLEKLCVRRKSHKYVCCCNDDEYKHNKLQS